MKLEDIILNETSQSQKDKYDEVSEVAECTQTQSRRVVPGELFHGRRVLVLLYERVPEIDGAAARTHSTLLTEYRKVDEVAGVT